MTIGEIPISALVVGLLVFGIIKAHAEWREERRQEKRDEAERKRWS